jgi:hypothetical protein
MTGPVQRAMTEAIESVASSEARVAILIRALARAGLTKVPERGPEVLRFLEGAWHEAIGEALGEEIADELLSQLRPLLRFAARPPSVAPRVGSIPPPRRGPSSQGVKATPSQEPQRRPSLTPEAVTAAVARAISITPSASRSVRPTVPADALAYSRAASPEAMVQAINESRIDPETLEPGPPESGTHTVLPGHYVLISRDEALSDAMEARFPGRFHCARGLMEILDISDELRGQGAWFVFDCIHAPVHIASLIMLTPDLPMDAEFVVLGASDMERETLATAVDRAVHWKHMARAALAREVIASLLAT